MPRHHGRQPWRRLEDELRHWGRIDARDLEALEESLDDVEDTPGPARVRGRRRDDDRGDRVGSRH